MTMLICFDLGGGSVTVPPPHAAKTWEADVRASNAVKLRAIARYASARRESDPGSVKPRFNIASPVANLQPNHARAEVNRLVAMISPHGGKSYTSI